MKCKLNICELPHSAKGYCNKHYLKWYTKGDPLWKAPKKINDYLIRGNMVEIRLENRKKIIVGVTLIDKDDFNTIIKHCWCTDSNGYAVSRINGKVIRMHRLLLNSPSLYVDHINQNKLDNRRTNLRLCKPKDNSKNHKGHNKTSKYKGVSRASRVGKWAVYGKFPNTPSNKRFWGYFDTEMEAAKKYNEVAKKYGNEFNYLNDV